MIIKQNFSLKNYNTFGISVLTDYFVELSEIDEIKTFLNLISYKEMKKLILGGGSNILFTKNFEGVVIKNNLKGIEMINEDHDYVYIKAGAGEVWHDLVSYCLKNNYAGVENLSLIPGNVGAAPMQNIGAYGVELKDVFYELEAINILNGNFFKFSKTDCKFGYRNSIFKSELKNQFIITSVTLQLRKTPFFNTSYGAIEQELKLMNVSIPSIQSISNAVCNIRKSKLPDPALIGNAGSFFKNPEIPLQKFNQLKENYPSIVGYSTLNNSVKVAAGWLIEQCGWKGKVIGNVGVHKNQALVLVNIGSAKGNEIYELALQIQKSVNEKFSINLEPEVNII